MSTAKQMIGRASTLAMQVGVMSIGTISTAGSVFAQASECTQDKVISGGLQTGIKCSRPTGVRDSLFGSGGIFQTVANVLIFIVGAISVIMLIVGAFRYVTSSGNAGQVESAKNTILYAIIGIVIALISFAAVNFVVSSLLES